MALEDTITELRNFVNANVVQNGTRNISGQQMNIILNSILNIILTLPGGGSSGYEFKAGYMFDINSEGITVTGDNVQCDDWIGWDIVLFFIGYGPLNSGPTLTEDFIASFSYEKETGTITKSSSREFCDTTYPYSRLLMVAQLLEFHLHHYIL